MSAKSPYQQRYRLSWEQLPEFSGWLKPLPGNFNKAYCKVCKKLIKAHLCDIKKHAAAKKHQKLMESLEANDGTYHEEESKPIATLDNRYTEEIVSPWCNDSLRILINYVTHIWKDYDESCAKSSEALVWQLTSQHLKENYYDIQPAKCHKKFMELKESFLRSAADSKSIQHKKWFYYGVFKNLFKKELERLETQDSASEDFTVKMEPFLEDNDELEEESHSCDTLSWTLDTIIKFLDLIIEFGSSLHEETQLDELLMLVEQEMLEQGHSLSGGECQKVCKDLFRTYNVSHVDTFPVLKQFTQKILGLKEMLQSRETKQIPIKGEEENSTILDTLMHRVSVLHEQNQELHKIATLQQEALELHKKKEKIAFQALDKCNRFIASLIDKNTHVEGYERITLISQD